VAAFIEALALSGNPSMFSTDQGSRFTSADFADVLKEADVGRPIDNVFVVCKRRTLEYDHMYVNFAETGTTCRAGIAE
jgi:putative transposase